MSFKYIFFLIVAAGLMLIVKQPTGAEQAQPAINQPSDTTGASVVFEIPEKRFGGSMSEDGTWAANAGLKIIATPQEQDLGVRGSFEIHSPGLAYHLKQKIIKGIFVLLVGERVFDGKGYYRYGHNVYASGYLTDTGFPVEGITNGLITNAFGGNTSHPINRIITLTSDDLKIKSTQGVTEGDFSFDFQIPLETPSGWYRFSMLIGANLDDKEFKTLWNENPAAEDLLSEEGTDFQLGMAPVGNPEQPHIPWTLLSEYVPGGGILPKHYNGEFAVTDRTRSMPRAILPLMKSEGGQIQYRLEPSIPSLVDKNKSPISLDISSAVIAIKIKTPKGNKIDLGQAKITGLDGSYLSTGDNKFTFAFSEYGKHEIEVTGFIKDRNGLIIGGGGIYDVYIANKLDIVTTLPTGFPFKEEENIDISLRVIPPVPAKIKIEKILNPWSQKGKIDDFDYNLTCNEWGIYTPSGEKIKKRWTIPEFLRFSRAGEYRVDIIAEYKDKNGALYMGAKTLAGVVTGGGNLLKLRGENSEQRRGYSETLNVITIPPNNDSIIAFSPESNLFFDPNLYVLLTDELKNQRILASDKVIEFSDGSSGCEPFSTASGFPAHWYPENIDRRMYVYSALGSSDGRTMFNVKDGGSMTDEMNPFTGFWGATEGDFFHLYSSLVLRDYPLNKLYYGTIASGAIASKPDSRVTLLNSSNLVIPATERAIPFMHSFNFFPGAIIENNKPFIPRCMIFPPTAGIIRIALTELSGEKRFINCIADERGILTRMIEEPILFWQEGVYTADFAFYPGVLKPEEITEANKSSHVASFPFYVVQNNRSNRFEWSIPSGSQIGTDQSITMNAILDENTLVEGKAYYTLCFNSELIEKGEVPFQGNGFEVSINLPRLIEKIPNFDLKDSYDVLEMGCMVKGVNPKGKNRFLASRITIHNGKIEY